MRTGLLSVRYAVHSSTVNGTPAARSFPIVSSPSKGGKTKRVNMWSV